MNARALRVFAEALILVKETVRLEAAGRDKEADRVHTPLAMVAELITTQLGETIPHNDPLGSDLQDVRDMLWHIDDAGLQQVRSFLSGRVRMTMAPDAVPMPPAPSLDEARAALGLGLSPGASAELEKIWDDLDEDGRRELLGRARELHHHVEREVESQDEDEDEDEIIEELSLGSLKVDQLPIEVDADVHRSGAIDVIVRIGAPKKGQA